MLPWKNDLLKKIVKKTADRDKNGAILGYAAGNVHKIRVKNKIANLYLYMRLLMIC